MSSKTTNYGLTKLDPGENLDVNGYAFVSSDRDRIDGLLSLGREHDHTGAATTLVDPDTAPVLVLDTTEGNLTAGQTYRYRYTYVDQFGSETAASPEATIATPAPIVEPDAVSISSVTTGGSLPGGLYNYALTAYVDTSTKETRRGSVAAHSIAYSTVTNDVTLALPTVPVGADGFNIYRRAPGESNYNFLASQASGPTTYNDDGSVNPNCDRNPPISNSTNSQNNVLVCLPGATPVVPAGATWKIYRSKIAGVWEATNLVQVTETVSDSDPTVVVCYQDLGAPTGFQTTPEVSQVVGMPDKIDHTNAAEIEGYSPPGLLIVPHEYTFELTGAPVAGIDQMFWRCPFEYAEIQNVTPYMNFSCYPDTGDLVIQLRRYGPNDATPVFEAVFVTTPKPRILQDDAVGTTETPLTASGDNIKLRQGDFLILDIDEDGQGATPMGCDLSVQVLMLIKWGSETVTDDITD